MNEKIVLKRILATVSSAAMISSSIAGSSFLTTAADTNDDVNYAKLLQYSLYLYDANMCGDDVEKESSLSWRGNCHTADCVVGGFHDAGDHVKFGLPAGYTANILGWSYYEFKDAYEATGQTAHFRKITDRFADYFKKSVKEDGKYNIVSLCYQVGDGGNDHKYWGPPESHTSDNINREEGLWTTNGGSDIAAEYAAALALNYLNFGNIEDLEYAKALFNFSINNNSAEIVDEYKNENFKDEQNVAAGWLYLATEESEYKDFLDSNKDNYNSYWTLNWENVGAEGLYLYGKINGNMTLFNNYVYDWCKPNDDSYRLINEWGSARLNTTAQFMSLVAEKNNAGSYLKWAEGQMEYIIGKKAVGSAVETSFVIGFDDFTKNTAKYAHHRAASDLSSVGNQDEMTPYGPNGHLIYGALVGGPHDVNGNYMDSASNYNDNEVALDYNAGLVAASAALYSLTKSDLNPLSSSEIIEKFGEDNVRTSIIESYGNDVSKDEKNGEIIGYNLVLDGRVGIDIYFKGKKPDENSLSVVSNDSESPVQAEYDSMTYDSASDCYIYRYKFPAQYLDYSFDIMYSSDEQVEMEKVVPKKVADTVVNGDGYTEKDSELAQKLINYCDSAKNYFNNDGVTSNESVSSSDLSDYKEIISEDLPFGIYYVGSSLVLESEIMVKHYFRIDERADVDSFSFSVGGNKVYPVMSGNYYYINMPFLGVDKLDTNTVLKINDIDDAVQYCPLSYVKAVLELDDKVQVSNKSEEEKQSSRNLTNLCKELYSLYKSAKNYNG